MGERIDAAKEATNERLESAREATGRRIDATREATGERVEAAKQAAAELQEKVKPRLRGVSHECAFPVSVLAGALLVIAAPGGRRASRSAIYAISRLRAARRRARSTTGSTGSGRRPALDAPPRPLDDLPADRGHLHAVRPARPRRHARDRDPVAVWAGAPPASSSSWSGSTRRSGYRRRLRRASAGSARSRSRRSSPSPGSGPAR